MSSFADKMSSFASVASNTAPPPRKKKKKKSGGSSSKDAVAPSPARISSSTLPVNNLIPPVILGGPVTIMPPPSGMDDAEKAEMGAHISRLINEQEMMPQAKVKKGKKVGHASKLEKHTLAVCAMIVDKMPTEEVWRAWAEGSDDSYSTRFFIHAAKPTSSAMSSWTRERLIPTSCAPKWNDYLIVAGILELLKAAMSDPSVTHCVVVTESCVPLMSFAELYRDLLGINVGGGEADQADQAVPTRPFKTYMSHYDVKSPRCTKFDSQSWFPKLQANGFPSDKSGFLRKALPGWSVLGREDCEGILRVDERAKGMWKIWEGVWAPEEVYLPTAINVHNGMKNVVERAINFAAWDERNPDVTKRANPFWFDGRFAEVRHQWIRQGAVFGRKFKDLRAEEWLRAVRGSNHENDGRDEREAKRQKR